MLQKFILILVYMADIFAALNHLNTQMQGCGVSIIEAEENLKVTIMETTNVEKQLSKLSPSG